MTEQDGAFDALVLGGGSAGCVLAARLSEDPDRSVCLVEAGPDYGPHADGGWPQDLLDARFLPDSHSWDASAPLERARVIGGCSTHNAAWLPSPPPGDCDGWERNGASGWGWSAVEPYLDRARRKLQPRWLTADETGPWAAAATAAAVASGIAELGNLSDASPPEGVGPTPVNMLGTVRWNAAFAYLDEARGRPNLTVLDQSLADRVLVDAGEARGAVVQRGGERLELEATTVVLAAGAYGSPLILLRSGIGGEAELDAAGIAVACDLPAVGANLQDHFGTVVVFRPGKELGVAISEREAGGWMIRGGPIIRTASSRCEDGTWDLHHVGWCAPDPDGVTGAVWRLQLSSYAMKPASRGSVRLRSTDPSDAPEIDHGYLSDADGQDLAVIADGIERVRKIAAFEPAASQHAGEVLPGPGARAREELEAYVRETVRAYFHPVGTCAMGRPDGSTVVDAAGRVHGVSGLHVGDASIMPVIPRVNTHLTTLATAERIADILRGKEVVD